MARYIIGKVLYLLGIITSTVSIAVLIVLNAQVSIDIEEFPCVSAAGFVGAALMAVSIVMDMIFSGREVKAMSEWKVASQYLNGRYIFQVYRHRNVNAVDHSGNREYKDELFDDEAAAQAFADELNAQEPSGFGEA